MPYNTKNNRSSQLDKTFNKWGVNKETKLKFKLTNVYWKKYLQNIENYN